MRKILICIIFIATFACPVSAQIIAGEIINVNYEYQIAFTDLTNKQLIVGDIVEIPSGIYLEVVDTSSAISKLEPVKNSPKYQKPFQFSEIVIGSTVRKIGHVDSIAEMASSLPQKDGPPMESQSETPIVKNNNSDALNELKERYTQLNANHNKLIEENQETQKLLQRTLDKLNAATQRIVELNAQVSNQKSSESNLQELQTTINQKNQEIEDLNKTIAQLKSKLNKMLKLIEGSK